MIKTSIVRVIATGEIVAVKPYDFVFVTAKGTYYTKRQIQFIKILE
jgi:hypothetical protein